MQPTTDRIAALDVLRGFALFGILVMNMPGFSRSLFTPPQPQASALDAAVVWLRDALFAGKFNLLFGTLFGIGFTLQLARLQAARPAVATSIYARRLAVLLVIGLVHASLLWAGDVLVIYALLGFALLGLRRLPDRALIAAIALCLLYPAVSEVLRPHLVSFETETMAAFEYQNLEAADNAAFGRGSLSDAMAQTARLFVWGYSSPLGLLGYTAFYVQMATGILLGFLIGRRRWVERLPTLSGPLRRAHLTSLAVVLLCTALWVLLAGAGDSDLHAFLMTLVRTLGRAALMCFYALSVVRLLERPSSGRLLRPLAWAGRMPLSNYLLQTLMGTAIFYGWGLGLWGRTSPTGDLLLAVALFFLVQLPLSAWWLGRFRFGPAEYLWRRLTYGPLLPSEG